MKQQIQAAENKTLLFCVDYQGGYNTKWTAEKITVAWDNV
jgi:hypothetical protein